VLNDFKHERSFFLNGSFIDKKRPKTAKKQSVYYSMRVKNFPL